MHRLIIAAKDWQPIWQHLLGALNGQERQDCAQCEFINTSFGGYSELNLSEESVQTIQLVIRAQDKFDAALLPHSICETQYKLACFDMDSTLIKAECIVELAREFGVMAEVDRITEEAMAGHLDFQESFERRLAMLKGLNEDKLKAVTERIEYSDGLAKMVAGLKSNGVKLAIFSGGFDFIANKLRDEFKFDYVHTNRLDIKNGVLTGDYNGELIDANSKKRLLLEYVTELNISRNQVIAVGDGANDIPMLKEAGLSVGYRPKTKVSEVVDVSLYHNGLDIIPAILAKSH